MAIFGKYFLEAEEDDEEKKNNNEEENTDEENNDDGEEDVGEEACQRLDDVDRVDDPVKADDEAERDGDAAQCVDEDVEPRVLVDVQVILDAAVDELVEHDADRQRCHEDADGDEEHLHQMRPVNPG